MPVDALTSAIRALEGNDAPRFDQIQEFLKVAKEAHARLPEHVYKYGNIVLKRYSGRLGLDELWALREDVAVAAMQVGRTDEAWILVDLVQRQFPESGRASRLLGMHFEATGDFVSAEELYKKELKKNPANALILRRMAAAKEGAGDVSGALGALRSYLEAFSTDAGAWEHAAGLYLRLAAYPQAIFCLEEVLLQQPGNANAQLLLAETLYAAGGAANWEAARGYFAGVIEITGGESTRALVGACACVAQLAKRGGGSDLGELAGEALRQQYAVRCPDKLALVEAMLKSQGVM